MQFYGWISQEQAEDLDWKNKILQVLIPLRFVTRPLSAALEWFGFKVEKITDAY